MPRKKKPLNAFERASLAKLEAVARWLVATPPHDQDRHFTIEIGVSSKHRVEARLHLNGIAKRRPNQLEDDRPLYGRDYCANGKNLGEALRKLHVPRARMRRAS